MSKLVGLKDQSSGRFAFSGFCWHELIQWSAALQHHPPWKAKGILVVLIGKNKHIHGTQKSALLGHCWDLFGILLFWGRGHQHVLPVAARGDKWSALLSIPGLILLASTGAHWGPATQQAGKMLL